MGRGHEGAGGGGARRRNSADCNNEAGVRDDALHAPSHAAALRLVFQKPGPKRASHGDLRAPQPGRSWARPSLSHRTPSTTPSTWSCREQLAYSPYTRPLSVPRSIITRPQICLNDTHTLAEYQGHPAQPKMSHQRANPCAATRWLAAIGRPLVDSTAQRPVIVLNARIFIPSHISYCILSAIVFYNRRQSSSRSSSMIPLPSWRHTQLSAQDQMPSRARLSV